MRPEAAASNLAVPSGNAASSVTRNTVVALSTRGTTHHTAALATNQKASPNRYSLSTVASGAQ